MGDQHETVRKIDRYVQSLCNLGMDLAKETELEQGCEPGSCFEFLAPNVCTNHLASNYYEQKIKFCSSNKLIHVDSTNASDFQLRKRIRHFVASKADLVFKLKGKEKLRSGIDYNAEGSNEGLVDEAQSLFIYHQGKNYKDFVDRTYKPMLFEEVNSILVKNSLLKQARNICGKVKECYFDIAATKIVKFGSTTKKEVEDYQNKKKDIKKVRVNLYSNCAGERVSERCDACGAGCRKSSSYTVIIILAVLFCVISAVVATILVFNYLYRHRPEQRKVIGETKQPEAPKPHSEPTEMAFVLPPLPKQHWRAINKN